MNDAIKQWKKERDAAFDRFVAELREQHPGLGAISLAINSMAHQKLDAWLVTNPKPAL